METTYAYPFFLFLLFCTTTGFSQQYFKLLEKSDKPYEQKIARFTNGDLLLAGSPIRGITANQNGGLNLSRLDQCGQKVWSKNFQWKQNFMNFKDFSISSKDEIYVYGTAYEGNSEFIYLLKLGPKGEELGFRVFSTGTVDNFTYNIEILPTGGIVTYGLLLDFNTPKRGFLAIFDEKLNPQWGKVFAPFESSGAAIVTADGGFICRSGVYTFKFNGLGVLQWAYVFESGLGGGDYNPIAGPIAVSGGYVFEAIQNEEAFFYKIDDNGQLVWKSDLFKTSHHGADLERLDNGLLLAVYNDPGFEENYPSQLWVDASGTIVRQRRLIIDQSLQIDGIYQSLGPKEVVSVIGTQDLKAAGVDRYAGFLLQTVLDSSKGKCFRWENFQSTRPNPTPIGVKTQAVSFFPLNLRNIEAAIIPGPLDYVFAESCDFSQKRAIRKDSILACGISWSVKLPNPDFIWEDGVPDNPRILEQPGLYRASDYNCISPLVYEYELSRQSCPCPVYLPNAFSPNGDGHNDLLELFSNCRIQEVQLSVYDRWGNRVFDRTGPKPVWDGTFRKNQAERGTYLVAVRYTLINESAELMEGTLLQNVLLLRE